MNQERGARISEKSMNKITRKELYERVWATPAYKLAEEFGLSGRGLGKLCERHRIPTPPRGYWAKKQHGKEVKRAKLPKLTPDEEDLTIIRVGRRPSELPLDDGEKALIDAENQENRAIEVPPQLSEPHPIVRRTRESFRPTRADKYGRCSAWGKDVLDVSVGPDSIDRAMRIMDALLKALESRKGFTVSAERPADIEVNGEKVEFSLMELSSREVRELRDHGMEKTRRRFAIARGDEPTISEFTPNGRLVLKIDSYSPSRIRSKWADGKKQRVEDCLNDFIASAIKVAATLRERRKEREEAQRRREEEARRRREREEQERIRAARQKALLEEVDAWHQARRIREYVNAVIEGRESTDEQLEWAEWARTQANKIDPLTELFGNEVEFDENG